MLARSLRTALATALVSAGVAVTGALAAASPAAAAGTTLYVSASATTNPACSAASQSNPFATVSAALLCATSGSTVNLSAGTFDGQVTIPRNLVLQGAGAATIIKRLPGFTNFAANVTVAEGRTVTLRNLTVDGVDQTTAGVAAGSGR